MRSRAVFAFLLLFSLSTFAQDRPMGGTVIDVDEGRNRLMIEMEDAARTRVTVETDAVSTTFHGFGTMIAGKPEIFTGSSGLSNVRLGDRISLRGSQRSENVYRAQQITLLGRDVAAPSVGVGQTRDPNSVSTPTDDRVTGTTADAANRIEGIVRQLNQDEGRIVVQTTTGNRLVTIRASRNTPVWYRGEQFRIANLELGDRIRIESDPRDAAADDIMARRIDVVMSVQESGTVPGTAGTITTLQGRITRVEPGLDYAYVSTGRGETRVDMSRAEDDRGEVLRARDLRAGDMVDMSGSYNRTGDIFQASTVRLSAGSPGGSPDDPTSPLGRYGLVTITGTVTETLEDASTLGFRDRDTNQTARIWIASGLVVRTRGNTYTTAEQLRVNDTAVIEAFRDGAGNLIAQTVRLRNR